MGALDEEGWRGEGRKSYHNSLTELIETGERRERERMAEGRVAPEKGKGGRMSDIPISKFLELWVINGSRWGPLITRLQFIG